MAQPDRPLAGQCALVTGASSGIGRGIALAFAEAGAAVAVNYRSDKDAAEEVVERIRSGGGTALSVGADVSREDQVEAMVEETVGRFGALDILVSNAGIQRDSALHKMSLSDWRAVIDVNLTGSFLCARAAVRHFLRQGARPGISRSAGKILFVSSVHEVIPWAFRANYAASKGGLTMLMKSLAQEVAGSGIRVNGLAPGAIRTPINREAWEDPDAHARLVRLIPYGRIGEPEDVARAAVWLASDAADYVTGTTFFVDGGMTLYPAFRGEG